MADSRFTFMVLHWPEPERTTELADGMRQMRDLMLSLPGCLAVEPPYLDQHGTCLVGISTWASKEAFLAAGLILGADDEIPPGEVRPRQRFLLEEVPAS